jgi:hypothetical protein
MVEIGDRQPKGSRLTPAAQPFRTLLPPGRSGPADYRYTGHTWPATDLEPGLGLTSRDPGERGWRSRF